MEEKERIMKKIVICIFLISFIQLFFNQLNNPVLSDTSYSPKINISKQFLNFDRCTKDSIPVLKFTISNQDDGLIKVTLKPSQNWIQLSAYSFEGHEQEIKVSINPANLSYDPGFYLEKIEIESDGGIFTLPVRLDLVEKKVEIAITYDNPKIFVNNKLIISKWSPYIKNQIKWIPLRIIFESVGAKVDYNSSSKLIIVSYKDLHFQFKIHSNIAEINGKSVLLQGEIPSYGGVSFIPLNSLVQMLLNVSINNLTEKRSTVIIY